MWLSLIAGLSTLFALVLLARRRVSATASPDQIPHRNIFVTVSSLLVLLVATPPSATIVLAVTTLGLLALGRLKTRILVMLSAASYVALTMFTVISQIVHRYPVTLDWPGRFDTWGSLAWTSVGFVAIAGWMHERADKLGIDK
jgi:hypothetical protein